MGVGESRTAHSLRFAQCVARIDDDHGLPGQSACIPTRARVAYMADLIPLRPATRYRGMSKDRWLLALIAASV